MIGLVLVTHGRLAEEFLDALEHIVGPQTNVAVVCIGPDDDMEERRQEIIDKVKAAQPDVQVYVYAADHGFNCDHRASHNGEAAATAKERTLAFFAEQLG